MKNLISFFSAIFLIMSFSFNVFANSNMVNLTLKYDGQVHKYSAEEVKITVDDVPITEFNMPPIILNDRTLVPLRDVFEFIGAEVSWNADTYEAKIQKDDNYVVFKINSSTAIKNGIDTITLDVPAKIINDYTMLPIRAVSSALDYEVDWDSTTRTVIINSIPKNDMTDDIVADTNDNSNSVDSVIPDVNQKQDGLKILWDQTYISINDNPEKRIPIEGLDVICPTWFEISNSDGDITDKGSIEYANWAKSQGYEIWALVSNIFDPTITHNTLSNSTKRKKIIDQLITYAQKYNLDGINIDFESINKEDGDFYLTFIKEATSAFKENNLTVSVDMYVPAPWTSHYQMEEVGKVVDYVIIMAYDEHYRTSSVSGSTSSLPWVEKYMDEAIKLVDKDKLIMGIPFYTRLWSEQNSTIVDSVAVTMEEVKEIIRQHNLTPIWLEDTKQYYIEYTENGLTKKIWIEDEASMEERMKLSRSYDVKGIACWKRGYETDDIWDIINTYYN